MTGLDMVLDVFPSLEVAQLVGRVDYMPVPGHITVLDTAIHQVSCLRQSVSLLERH